MEHLIFGLNEQLTGLLVRFLSVKVGKNIGLCHLFQRLCLQVLFFRAAGSLIIIVLADNKIFQFVLVVTENL